MSLLRLYQHAISWVEHHSPGPDKFDHTYLGLAIWLGAAMLGRRPLRSGTPILVLAAFELANETMDRLTVGRWIWHDTLGDVAATLFWPICLCFLLRTRRVRA